MDFITVTQSLLEGFGITCLLFILTLILAIPLGLLISFGTMSKIAVIRKPFKVIVWVIRGVPLMLQLFIVYYLPGMLSSTGSNFWGKLDNIMYFEYGIEFGGPIIATLIAFVINYAAYFSEIFRGGIEAIPKGQYEAGQVLGLSKSQIFFKVVLMQVVKHIIPPMSNEIITLVKDTALAQVLGVIDLLNAAKHAVNHYVVLTPFLYAAIFYLIFNGLLTLLFGWIEKKLSYYKV